MTPHQEHRRLFYALWPADVVRDSLAQALQVPLAQGRPIPPRNLHLTLVFLGETPVQQLDAVLQAGAEAVGEGFELLLDRLEFWRRSNLLCLTPKHAPLPLIALVDSLRAALARREFRVDERPYRAHVTLVRDVATAARSIPIAPLRWPVEDFTLVDSRMGPTGSHYTVLERWPLRK